MKKMCFVFVFFIFLFALVGCRLTDEMIVKEIGQFIVDNTDNEISSDYEFITTYQEYDFEIKYSSDNDSIITDEGIINLVEEDREVTLNFTINYNGVSKTFSKKVVVLKADKNEIINEIAKNIINNTPKSVENDFSFITSYLDFDFEVEYFSNDTDAISNEGKVKRLGFNNSVLINFNITYKGITEGYDMYIIVPKIDSNIQIDQVKEWLDEYMVDLLANESGKLPSVDPHFGLAIQWNSSEPGVIDGANNLNVAYEAVDVELIASYKIGIQAFTAEYTYRSKGLDLNNKTEYIDNFFKNLISDKASLRTNIIYDGEIEVIQSIVSPNTVTQLRPKDPNDPNKGVKMPGGVKWVVIHDTGNPAANAGAELHNRYIHNQANDPNGRVASWHYTIDDTLVYQHVPDDEQAWHAGDNNLGRLKGGNSNGIGIETCINPESDYEVTLRRTAKLTAGLLYKYNLQLENVVQHYDFSQKNCPAVIRNNGWWNDFLGMVERELFLIIIKENSDNKHVLKWTIDRSDIIDYSGKVVKTPINDEIVNISLEVTIENFSKTYEYTVIVPGMSITDKISSINTLLYRETAKTASGDISLIKSLPDYRATIKWSSSHPHILDADGKYNKPSEKTLVTMYAAITIDNKTFRKEYKVLVS